MRTGADIVRVIGIGNRDRGDDGIGPLIAEEIENAGATDISVLVREGDALALIEDWQAFERVIVIDAAAAVSGGGTLHRIDLKAETIPSALYPASTHAFGIAEAVGLARALDLLPRQLILYAIEGARFEAGAPMSAAVTALIKPAAERILREARTPARAIVRDGAG